MRYYISADYHLGHGNVVKYDNAPFKDADARNKAIIHNHNSRIKSEDIFIHNGDFCFKSGEGCNKAEYWINQLNGKHIFIRGNHDKQNSLKTIIDCLHITYANKRINIVHKPEHANPNFEINLIGHVHTKWKIRTFKEHYNVIKEANNVIASDRRDWENFLINNENNKNSDSILLNVGVSVQNYMPITLDEALGQIVRYKKGIIK